MEKPNRCRDRDRDSDSDLDLDSDLVVSDSLLPESNLDAPDVSTPGPSSALLGWLHIGPLRTLCVCGEHLVPRQFLQHSHSLPALPIADAAEGPLAAPSTAEAC
ncbi:MAG: hypothetical protein N838_28090 [Thiohalocapsa sp. PB-PSB1]|nr:MAG: hypothetical protein N838_28090 [Thiohalocapsa sp. PB-PSB1]